MRTKFNSWVVVAMVAVMSCSDSSDPSKIANSNIVGPQGGEMEDIGIKLTFPPGAVATSTQILAKRDVPKTAIGALITNDESVVLPYSLGWELWPQDVLFLVPVSVSVGYNNSDEVWYQPSPGKDSKYFYNWKPVLANSTGFTTTTFSKFLQTGTSSKDILVYSGPLRKNDLIKEYVANNSQNGFLKGYKAVYDAPNTRYTARVTLFTDTYVAYLFFEETPINNKSYTVMDAYTNGYGRANTSQIELGFSSGCGTTTCDYFYRSRTGQVKYFIQNGVHKVLFKNVSFTDPATREEMQIDGYVILN